MQDVLGYYKILEVSFTADSEEIKNAYRAKAKLWHPDSNPDPEAVEIFRQLSMAHTVLGDPKSRRRYDLLSLCCTPDNYPQNDDLNIIKDDSETVNLRAISQKIVTADFCKYQIKSINQAINYHNALKLNFYNACNNWLRGWWHYKALFLNFRTIISNFSHPINLKDSCRLLLLNMLAHEQAGNLAAAAQCGLQACDYLDAAGQDLVKQYVSSFGVTLKRPRPWNIVKLRLAQLAFPLIILVISLGFLCGDNIKNIFSSSSAINYYQKISLDSQNNITDDVIVGKVINIPVDKTDISKLYHLKQAVKIMYGPSDKFDAIKQAPAGMTVRLTGITPDNVWARIMIDNGEMGFVRYNMIVKGKGSEIPFGSAIIE